jgi:ABC-type glycerol-3-phosphate transport system permease component
MECHRWKEIGPRPDWAVHISVAALVLLWLFPTVGLFVSSFRTADQISVRLVRATEDQLSGRRGERVFVTAESAA